MLTRGINTTQFHSSSLWPHGPQWLPFVLQFSDPATAASNAVTMTDGTTQTDPEDKRPGIHNLIDVSRLSTLSSLLAVTAYVLRFVKNLQNNATKTVGPLSVQERQDAQRKWIQNSQAQIYADEISNLRSKSSTHLTLVRQLRLFLDADCFLRCGGGGVP